MGEPTISDASDNISWGLGALQQINAQPDTRSRELSLAITNLEQALMWLDKAPAPEPIGNE